MTRLRSTLKVGVDGEGLGGSNAVMHATKLDADSMMPSHRMSIFGEMAFWVARLSERAGC
ncbi:hypothetical protein RBI13_09740 [Alcaligenaceae bacterium A4P071]|nr:hypothetical protein [Alcaligenaceae bacterium A4P071]